MDQEIVMSTGILQVYAIKRKTQANLFKSLKTGSKIKCSLSIKSPGRSSHGSYATYVNIENLDTGEKALSSLTVLSKVLDCFEFINVQE